MRISIAATDSSDDRLVPDENDIDAEVDDESSSGRKKDVEGADDSWSQTKSLYTSEDDDGVDLGVRRIIQ